MGARNGISLRIYSNFKCPALTTRSLSVPLKREVVNRIIIYTIMAECVYTSNSSDIDRLSGQSLRALNDAIKETILGEEGFKTMDDISAKIFPSVFAAIKNCLQKPLQKHPRYARIDFLWTGSTSEGVNIPNMSRKADGQVEMEFEMDILCVFRDVDVGTTMDSPVVMVEQEDTSKGYFLLYVNSAECRQKWGHFCTVPGLPKRKEERYLNPLLMVEDLYKQIEHIFGQIPLLKDKFTLEFNPPAVTLCLGGSDNVKVSCDVVVALELPISNLPQGFFPWIQSHGQPTWCENDTLQQLRNESLHLVGKCSPKGQARVEWRLSFNRLELGLLKEIQARFPSAITCYRILKSIRLWHLNYPDFLHSYHLKMIFLRACNIFPTSCWSEDNIASNILGLLDDLFHSLATHHLPSYFFPECNLIEGIHSDFIMTLIQKLSYVRKDPIQHVIKLKR